MVHFMLFKYNRSYLHINESWMSMTCVWKGFNTVDISMVFGVIFKLSKSSVNTTHICWILILRRTDVFSPWKHSISQLQYSWISVSLPPRLFVRLCYGGISLLCCFTTYRFCTTVRTTMCWWNWSVPQLTWLCT